MIKVYAIEVGKKTVVGELPEGSVVADFYAQANFGDDVVLKLGETIVELDATLVNGSQFKVQKRQADGGISKSKMSGSMAKVEYDELDGLNILDVTISETIVIFDRKEQRPETDTPATIAKDNGLPFAGLKVLVNGKPASFGTKLKSGDKVELTYLNTENCVDCETDED